MVAHASHGKKLEKASRILENLEILAVHTGQHDGQTQQILAGIINGLSQHILSPAGSRVSRSHRSLPLARPMLSFLRAVPSLTCRLMTVSLPECVPRTSPIRFNDYVTGLGVSSGNPTLLHVAHDNDGPRPEVRIHIGLGASVMTMYEGDTVQWRENDSERRFYGGARCFWTRWRI